MTLKTDYVNGENVTSTQMNQVGTEVNAAVSDIAGKQPLDSDLTAIAALTTTAFGRSLLALADAGALLTAAGAQPSDADLTALAALTTTAYGRALLELANAAALRTAAGLVIGTDVQAYAAALTPLSTASQIATVAAAEATASTSYTDLTTPGPAVVWDVPANGKAKVTVSGSLTSPSTAAGLARMSYALTGGNTLAAGSGPLIAQATAGGAPVGLLASRVHVLTGLLPGSTTFTAKYSVSAGTGTFAGRAILVEPIA